MCVMKFAAGDGTTDPSGAADLNNFFSREERSEMVYSTPVYSSSAAAVAAASMSLPYFVYAN